MKYNKLASIIVCIQMQSSLQIYSCHAQASQQQLVSKVSFNAIGVCKDIQYNEKHVSFLDMVKLNISETVIEIKFWLKCFRSNPKIGVITFISDY